MEDNPTESLESYMNRAGMKMVFKCIYCAAELQNVKDAAKHSVKHLEERMIRK